MKNFGIDVSAWQGDVDWKKVKQSGVKFAILRCGYGMDSTRQDDNTFERNANECERLGIPYGVYLYSYATNISKAKSEANHVLRLIKGRKLEYPVYLDLEDPVIEDVGRSQILRNARTFVDIIENAGYWVGIYANLNWWENYLTDPWYDTKSKWVAQYNSECQYRKDYGIWQYSSSGTVNGVDGNVDLNYSYVDYPTLIRKAGKNGFSKEETHPAKKTIDEIAREVLNGKWGNGKDRVDRLTKAGYNYDKVQSRVNAMSSKKKSITEVAKEVIRGEWGNGQERIDRLTKAGYDVDEVQNRVNELL